jgi:hypothetical protein
VEILVAGTAFYAPMLDDIDSASSSVRINQFGFKPGIVGDAFAGSVMIAAVTSAFIANINQSPAIPSSVKSQAQVELAGGVPFVSDADLEHAPDEANIDQQAADAAVDAYADARISGLTSSLALLAFVSMTGLFLAQRIPRSQPA